MHMNKMNTVVALLLPHCPINLQDVQGRTAIHVALESFNFQATLLNGYSWLLGDPSVDVNIQDENGKTPLISLLAGTPAGPYPVRLLRVILARCDLNITLHDHGGWTALHHMVAGHQPPSLEHLELLLAHPRIDVSFEPVTSSGRVTASALEMATRSYETSKWHAELNAEWLKVVDMLASHPSNSARRVDSSDISFAVT